MHNWQTSDILWENLYIISLLNFLDDQKITFILADYICFCQFKLTECNSTNPDFDWAEAI